MIFPFIVIEALMKDEGFRARPYKDTMGKTTVGYGRNLDDNPLTIPEAKALLLNDVTRTVAAMDARMPWYRTLNDVRKAVLINMAFNLGVLGLLTFRKMIAAIQRGDFVEAAREMRSSKWYQQVGHRAERLAKEMETGEQA